MKSPQQAPTYAPPEALHSYSREAVESRLDSESAMWLRATLTPIFESAQSWPGLAQALRQKGFALAFRKGRLMLLDTERGQRICTCRFLGSPLSDLAQRLGRLPIRAGRGGANGDLLI